MQETIIAFTNLCTAFVLNNIPTKDIKQNKKNTQNKNGISWSTIQILVNSHQGYSGTSRKGTKEKAA